MISALLAILPADAYAKLNPLLEGVSHHLTVLSIAAGDTQGIIYVDDPLEPHAFLCRYQHRLYLAGSAEQPAFNQALVNLFEREIYPQTLADGGSALVVHYDDRENWDDALGLIGGNRLSERYQRSYYRWVTPVVAPALPETLTIEPIDDALLKCTDLVGYDELVEELQSERRSAADFLERSFGFCALAGDTIAGMCTSEYNSRGCCEVGINTMSEFRRRGVAKALVARFVAAARAQGINQIGWHCWTTNTPSVAPHSLPDLNTFGTIRFTSSG